MDNTSLVDSNLSEGKRILTALDASDFRVTAAFWLYVSDSSEWRLMFASNYVDQKGPTASYKYVQEQLEKLVPLSTIAIANIGLLSPKHDLVKLLRIAIQTGPGISGIRFTRNIINGTLIEDAYIYRIL